MDVMDIPLRHDMKSYSDGYDIMATMMDRTLSWYMVMKLHVMMIMMVISITIHIYEMAMESISYFLLPYDMNIPSWHAPKSKIMSRKKKQARINDD